jgi:hypothetical protein
MPFEIFAVPALVCLVLGFIRGRRAYRQQAGHPGSSDSNLSA